MMFNHKSQETSDPNLVTTVLKSLFPPLHLVLRVDYMILLEPHIPFLLGLSFYISFFQAVKHEGERHSY